MTIMSVTEDQCWQEMLLLTGVLLRFHARRVQPEVQLSSERPVEMRSLHRRDLQQLRSARVGLGSDSASLDCGYLLMLGTDSVNLATTAWVDTKFYDLHELDGFPGLDIIGILGLARIFGIGWRMEWISHPHHRNSNGWSKLW
jgi:hypothetical protein